MRPLLIFLLLMNTVAFVIMGYDKLKAKVRGWRVPEINLFLLALLGGAPGVWLGMRVFRHKTQHSAFTLGIPILFLINLILIYVLSGKSLEFLAF